MAQILNLVGKCMRSKKLHDIWISGLECPIIRIEGDMTVKERVSIVKDKIKRNRK